MLLLRWNRCQGTSEQAMNLHPGPRMPGIFVEDPDNNRANDCGFHIDITVFRSQSASCEFLTVASGLMFYEVTSTPLYLVSM